MRRMVNQYAYTIHTERTEGGYLVTVPSLPGCITWGHTLEEAKCMGREAILAYLESLAKEGRPLPIESYKTSKVNVSIAA